MACDDLIDVTGRAAIQAVVPLSAGQAAGGPAQQGKRRAGVRIQTRRVTHWQNGNMVMRWLVLAFIRTEKRFNKIMGHRDLWAFEAILNDAQPATGQVAA